MKKTSNSRRSDLKLVVESCQAFMMLVFLALASRGVESELESPGVLILPRLVGVSHLMESPTLIWTFV